MRILSRIMMLPSLLSLLLISGIAIAEDKPNVVVMMVDNLGWGELGVYGGGVLRGAETPRLDQFAGEGTRLVEFRKTLVEEPPIQLGTPDPYTPPK